MGLDVFNGLRVLVTGHTGFKGAWLCLLLSRIGANILGFSLDPPSTPNLFSLAGLDHNPPEGLTTLHADILDSSRFQETVRDFKPDVIIHMAAQALVRASYHAPVSTLATNIIGTANLLEACRVNPPAEGKRRVVVVVTSDKCYENREWIYGYREVDRLGGHDPYSASKGCAELVVASYRSSFFPSDRLGTHRTLLATARAGNVLGGGDFAMDRLVPDMVRAFADRRPIVVRHPDAVRPWQHVLEPLHGYLLLAARMLTEGSYFAGAWNFGPDAAGMRTVGEVASLFARYWGEGAAVKTAPEDTGDLHEAGLLTLDCTKARVQLGWKPKLTLDESLARTAQWYKLVLAGNSQDSLRKMVLDEIEAFIF